METPNVKPWNQGYQHFTPANDWSLRLKVPQSFDVYDYSGYLLDARLEPNPAFVSHSDPTISVKVTPDNCDDSVTSWTSCQYHYCANPNPLFSKENP